MYLCSPCVCVGLKSAKGSTKIIFSANYDKFLSKSANIRKNNHSKSDWTEAGQDHQVKLFLTMLGHWIVGIWSWSINWTHAIAKVFIYPGLDVRPCLLSLCYPFIGKIMFYRSIMPT